ncbi:phage tail protein [Cupriavidus pampae]|uniref:Phage tail collar domain-containing protein n=1 Tax=Cupriavidus pampae TaxID=659251 RepID=A0ABN7ZKG6_9BURK|nr:tail fiber protein [Cupriavidus pampae]CAG9186459.1 hypothetical protein LMG32289_06438 [Cupriavidus pampae]
MSDQYYGEIRIFSCTYPPAGWAECNGQLMPIAQNTVLFSLLGTTYGGDGRTTFALPDLRGCAVSGPVANELNAPRGADTVTLLANEIPVHTHAANTDNVRPSTPEPAGRLPARFQVRNNQAYLPTASSPAPVMTTLSPQMIAPTGGTQSHENRQPNLALRFCIALTGNFPPRS